MAHKWARWLHNLYHLGGPDCFKVGDKISQLAHEWARWLHNPYRLGGPHRFRAEGKTKGGPQVCRVLT